MKHDRGVALRYDRVEPRGGDRHWHVAKLTEQLVREDDVA